VTRQVLDLSTWPIVTAEDEAAVLEVLHARSMSGTGVTKELEREYAQWEGSKYALACNNGTSAIHCAMYGLGIGRGDEVITPTRLAFSDRDVRQGPEDCPVAEKIVTRLIHIPRMIKYDEECLDQLAAAYVEVLTNLDQLEGTTSDQVLERATTLG